VVLVCHEATGKIRGKFPRVVIPTSTNVSLSYVVLVVVNKKNHERGQSVSCISMLSTFTVQPKATLLTAVVFINRSELSAVLVTTFRTLPSVSWLSWWLFPVLLSM